MFTDLYRFEKGENAREKMKEAYQLTDEELDGEIEAFPDLFYDIQEETREVPEGAVFTSVTVITPDRDSVRVLKVAALVKGNFAWVDESVE